MKCFTIDESLNISQIIFIEQTGIYMYIYIQKERETEKEKDREKRKCTNLCKLSTISSFL